MIAPQVSTMVHATTLISGVVLAAFTLSMMASTSSDARERFTGATRWIALVVASLIAWIALEVIVRVIISMVV